MNLFKSIASVIISLSIFFSACSLAEVTATVDRIDISAGETFQLEIISENATDEQPDLSLIPKDFTIVSNSQYSHTQIINGKRSFLKGWKIKLKTLKTGKVTIPPISVGSEFTNPIELEIKDASDQLELNGQKKTIFLEANVDQESPYVQQQVVLTITLYRAVNTHYARLSEPHAANSIVEKLGDDIQFEKSINNRRYVVTQRKYAIFPQQSGELTIGAINFTADVNDSNQRGYGNFLSSTRPVSITTKPIDLNVRPQPQNASSPWLPAHKVALTQHWTPDTSELKVGEPITWTISLAVDGLSESQLPEIKVPNIEGLQWYYDTPQKERKVTPSGIKGQRIEKIAVIPSKQGKVTIPDITLEWWDINSNSKKQAKLAGRTINVVAGAANNALITSPPLLPQVTQPQEQPIINPADSENLRVWQLLTGVATLLWLITLTLLVLKKSPKQVSKNTAVEVNQQITAQAKTHKKACITAINNKDYPAIEKHLLNWLALLGHVQINSIGKLISKLQDSPLKDSLIELQSVRYSAQQQDKDIQLKNLDLDELNKQLNLQPRQAACSVIPPLYPR
ncbi:BatD family protein [Aliikangiella sp. IMCC44653]